MLTWYGLSPERWQLIFDAFAVFGRGDAPKTPADWKTWARGEGLL